jgi:hypothetical protein
MSKILRRPLFRGGRVDSTGVGITHGLDHGLHHGYAIGGHVSKQTLEQNAPEGEFLAYINPREAALLKAHGGSGRATKYGIPSFEELFGSSLPQDVNPNDTGFVSKSRALVPYGQTTGTTGTTGTAAEVAENAKPLYTTSELEAMAGTGAKTGAEKISETAAKTGIRGLFNTVGSGISKGFEYGKNIAGGLGRAIPEIGVLYTGQKIAESYKPEFIQKQEEAFRASLSDEDKKKFDIAKKAEQLNAQNMKDLYGVTHMNESAQPLIDRLSKKPSIFSPEYNDWYNAQRQKSLEVEKLMSQPGVADISEKGPNILQRLGITNYNPEPARVDPNPYKNLWQPTTPISQNLSDEDRLQKRVNMFSKAYGLDRAQTQGIYDAMIAASAGIFKGRNLRESAPYIFENIINSKAFDKASDIKKDAVKAAIDETIKEDLMDKKTQQLMGLLNTKLNATHNPNADLKDLSNQLKMSNLAFDPNTLDKPIPMTPAQFQNDPKALAYTSKLRNGEIVILKSPGSTNVYYGIVMDPKKGTIIWRPSTSQQSLVNQQSTNINQNQQLAATVLANQP